MRCLTITIALSFVLTGCGASKTLQLPLSYASKVTTNKAIIETCNSTFYLSDKRKNKSLGQMSGQAVLAQEDIKIWVKQAAVQEFGEQLDIQWTDSNEILADQWVIELKKAYVMNQTTNMAATTVFILRNGDTGFNRVYRGNVTHSNWASGVNETITVLNASLKDGLEKMRGDINSVCNSLNNV